MPNRRHTAPIALALVLAGCAATEPTQVMVQLDAEPTVRQMASQVRLVVRAGAADAALDTYVTRFDSTFESSDTAIHWGRQVALVPMDPDVPGRYWVEVTAIAADGTVLGVGRRISGYDRDRAALLQIVLEDGCLNVICDDVATTCEAGLCEPATVAAEELPNLPVDSSG